VLGFIFIDRIEALLESAKVVAWALLIGGIAMLVIERTAPKGTEKGVADISLGKAIGVGLIQCLAMIPGVSRSGATILGGLSLGIERRTAAEFSFFLAIPTMLGATVLTLLKDHDKLGAVGMGGIALGFLVSFVVAVVVIKWFMAIVTKRGFAPFAWYRIVVGAAAIAWLTLR
jgi:undecaprenyl-diphosphatase